jgi:hypothetical protein
MLIFALKMVANAAWMKHLSNEVMNGRWPAEVAIVRWEVGL